VSPGNDGQKMTSFVELTSRLSVGHEVEPFV
jgi:hypothetical protein